MKHILVLGAGQSAPYLISYLLQQAKEHDWFVTVGDRDISQAQKTVGDHPCGTAVAFDINDAALRATLFGKANLVVNFLSPVFQHLVALECINYGTSMVSASYVLKKVEDLDLDAHRKGIIILNEMGLDPGIDHMSAMALIREIRNREGIITSFVSYGSGLPAPEVKSNPLRYCITWNPANVVRAGEVGAQYKENGEIKVLSYHQVFNRTWSVDVEGIGTLEAYPNRNSLVYQDLFGLENVDTMIRGTLRYPGWSETWQQIVRLGLPNNTMPIPDLAHRTYAELVRMFLPAQVSGGKLEARVASLLNINPTGKIMENLKWLGLFSREVIGGEVATAADVMTNLLKKKLALPPDGRDMVILMHEVDVRYPAEKDRRERIQTTMIEFGQPGGFTAISKTVGLPAAIAARLILTGELPLTGCHIPTRPAIYEPVLAELKSLGLKFSEKVIPIPPEGKD